MTDEQKQAKEQKRLMTKAESEARAIVLKYQSLNQSVSDILKSAETLPEWEHLKDTGAPGAGGPTPDTPKCAGNRIKASDKSQSGGLVSYQLEMW